MSSDLRGDLRRLASNHAWTYTAEWRRLLDLVPGVDDETHPVLLVDRLDDTRLRQLEGDAGFIELLSHVMAQLDHLEATRPAATIAYVSPEFGLTALLPQYAGGLGILAGDHLKTGSDLSVGLVGVGLFYRQGVFHQVIANRRQVETYGEVDPDGVGADDTGKVVSIPFPGRDVLARVWRMEVGRTTLLLLDTDVLSNADADRTITDRLYVGSRQHRIDQEMVLGVGGALALEACGFEIGLHHLNEGHAGFITLALIDRVISDGNLGAAVERIRDGLVFTTHTPVAAGIDRFERHTLQPYLEVWSTRWEMSVDELWELGVDPHDPDKFNMAALCLRSSVRANGVSRLHGQVSRKLFAGVGIGDSIGHVTNGVHARSWTGEHMQSLLDEALGTRDWANGSAQAWDRVEAIDDESLLVARHRSSETLATLIEARTRTKLNPEALIVGFARRFAPYKRATLLLRRLDLLRDLLADDSRPVHLVFAGKAHPTDGPGKHLVTEIIDAAETPELHGRITFIADYDMSVGHAMVQGADVWLNNPIQPREASGTSGEKAVLNGVLNCSVLDGWWAEMFDGVNGWSIEASGAADEGHRDFEEATSMLETIAAISNEYHTARPVFLGRIRHAWRTLGPRVVSARMLRDYQATMYTPGE
ncbi:MAG TPA: alpha-glucan family phosphorylase [Acidimicrobiia bacterium]|nr:alpha-glucan family phosphorylase [Acidimicrobiia bacterium]